MLNWLLVDGLPVDHVFKNTARKDLREHQSRPRHEDLSGSEVEAELRFGNGDELPARSPRGALARLLALRKLISQRGNRSIREPVRREHLEARGALHIPRDLSSDAQSGTQQSGNARIWDLLENPAD